ncbi:MAG TPA: tRNA lysidine(34) synthetase TilS [Trichormus sp.]
MTSRSDKLVEQKIDTAGGVDDFAGIVGLNLQKAFKQAETLGVVEPNAVRSIVIGLSGGPDSCALLFALHAVAERLSLRLTACHVNHGLRGDEADGDQAFCEELCHRLKVPLIVKRVTIDSTGGASEDELRQVRYGYLRDVASEVGSRFIVVAHTVDDQVETLLFRLFRGTSLAGLCGMSAARATDGVIAILRPLLNVSRQSCLRFLEQQSTAARLDSSNQNTRYTRNYIRKEIIPLIEGRFAGFKQRLEQLRQVIVEENSLLDEIGRSAIDELESDDTDEDARWQQGVFMELHPAIRRRSLVIGLQERGVEVSFERVEEILEMWQRREPPAISLDENWDVRVAATGDLIWQCKSLPAQPRFLDLAVKLPGTTLVAVCGFALKIEEFDEPGAVRFPAATDLTALVDLSQIGSNSLILRGRRAGDFIQPFGMSETVKLKKYLHTHKRAKGAPREVALAVGSEVLWLPGVGLSEKLRVRNRPTHRLSLLPLADDVAVC